MNDEQVQQVDSLRKHLTKAIRALDHLAEATPPDPPNPDDVQARDVWETDNRDGLERIAAVVNRVAVTEDGAVWAVSELLECGRLISRGDPKPGDLVEAVGHRGLVTMPPLADPIRWPVVFTTRDKWYFTRDKIRIIHAVGGDE